MATTLTYTNVKLRILHVDFLILFEPPQAMQRSDFHKPQHKWLKRILLFQMGLGHAAWLPFSMM